MSNFCAKHNQFYSDYCVYCGSPAQVIDTTNTFICLHEYVISTAGEYCKKCGAQKP